MPSFPNWTHLCRLCFASLPSLLSLPIFANLFFLLYRSVKREQIVDQGNSLTTRIMRDKKVVENSSVGRDRAAAAVALFSRRSSEGEGRRVVERFLKNRNCEPQFLQRNRFIYCIKTPKEPESERNRNRISTRGERRATDNGILAAGTPPSRIKDSLDGDGA